MLPLFARICNMRFLCGTHISARISMRWSQFRGSLLKSVQNAGACIIKFVLIDSISTPSEGEDYISSSVTYTNCFMAYLFFQTAQLLPLTLNLTTLVSNTISLYMYLPPTQMLFIIHFFCDAPRTWNLLPHSVTSLPSLNQFKRSVSNFM